MRIAPTLRFEWKSILFFCVLGASLIYVAFDLYRAWAFGVIRTPILVFHIPRATLAHEPDIFWTAVALDALGLLILSPFLGFAMWSLRLQARGLRIREARPPIDDAIREPPDQR
jgi:hypothetical protein